MSEIINDLEEMANEWKAGISELAANTKTLDTTAIAATSLSLQACVIDIQTIIIKYRKPR